MRRAMGAAVLLAVAGTVWGQTPAREGDVRMARVTACLTGPVRVKGEPDCKTLAEQMAAMHVPGVSIAVLHAGRVEWARGFGERDAARKPVDAETLFQAGSISKPLAAMAALKLVEQGKLQLDADVTTELKSWKLPESPAAGGEPLTLRELLTHTGATTVHGFPGYAAGAAVPTLVEVLDGEKPANTAAIRVEAKPGTRWNYSGGGYTVMQQMMLDASGTPFPALLESSVLGPMGMTHSTYQQPLPETRRVDAAAPFDGQGHAVAGGAHTYPEMAAAGLWTTPTDLLRYVAEVEQTLAGKGGHVLSEAMTQTMVTPGMGSWGLGVQIGGAEGNRYFMHGGSNAGFEDVVVGYERGGEGVAVMTNATQGNALAMAIVRSVAAEYGWPDFAAKTYTVAAVDPAVLAKYVGTYALAPNVMLAVTVENGVLVGQIGAQPKVTVYPESERRFFVKQFAAEIEFVVNDKGETTGLVLHGGPKDQVAKKQ